MASNGFNCLFLQIPLRARTSLYTLTTVKASLSMKDLREVAVSTGAYDVGSSNCHHAALAVYNECVPAADLRVEKIPNFAWTRLAGRMKEYLGFDFANSNLVVSTSFGAASESQSRCLDSWDFPLGCDQMDAELADSIGLHQRAASLAKWIYEPNLNAESLRHLRVDVHCLRAGQERPVQ